jgi:N-sulfoglucosamine sulfohydrolase
VEADPFEVKNLVSSNKPADREALERLRDVLEDWIKDSNDQGRIPEPPEVAKAEGATKPKAAGKAKKKNAKQ